MNRPPNLKFWVMDAKGKAYKTTVRIAGEKTCVNGEGEVKKEKIWKPGKPYLSPTSKRFEESVAICAEKAGAYMMEWVKLRIDIYWPARKKKCKARAVEYPLNRPDNTNIQKSVEDALQEKRMPYILKKRHSQCLDKIAEAEENPMVKSKYWEKMLATTIQEIATFKTVTALCGVVMKNDSRVQDIHTRLFWLSPESESGKCIHVSVWEVDPTEYYTKELTEWLKGE